MNSLNTQDNTILSSNFSKIELISKKDREILKKAQTVETNQIEESTLQQGVNSILEKYIQETGRDPFLVTQAFEALNNLRALGGYETLLDNTQILLTMADMIDKGVS